MTRIRDAHGERTILIVFWGQWARLKRASLAKLYPAWKGAGRSKTALNSRKRISCRLVRPTKSQED